MENPFSYSDYVTGEAFCNKAQEQKDLIYYAQNSQNVLLYSHRRMGKTSLVHQVKHRLKKAKPTVNSIYIDLYGSLSENDFIKQMAGLKVTGRIDPVTSLPTLSASILPREKPEYLEKALAILAPIPRNKECWSFSMSFRRWPNIQRKVLKSVFAKLFRSIIISATYFQAARSIF
jgi:AAA+ ATPase superfamily predicted ATPase